MARLLTTGAEAGDKLDWSAYHGSQAHVSGTVAHTGTYSYYINGSDGYYRLLVANKTELWIRSWVQMGDISNSPVIFDFGVGSSRVRVRINADGSISLLSGDTTVLNTFNAVILPNIWYMFEVYLYPHDTTGVFQVKVDGVVKNNYSGDTVPGTGAAITYVDFRGINWTNTYHDDIAVNDNSGGVDDSWCGDGRVIALKPNAAGDVTGFTPSAGANYDCVNEVPPNDSDYVEDNVDGTYDIYNLEASGLTGVTIARVSVEVTALKTVAEDTKQRPVIKTDGTKYDGDDKDLLTSYTRYKHVWRFNPYTSAMDYSRS